MGRVKFTSHLSKVLASMGANLDKTMLNAALDIDRTSAELAPKLHRNLVKSRKVIRKGEAYYVVSYGSAQVQYAVRRHYENKKNPQTLRYLERAGDSVRRNITKYVVKL